MGLGLGIILSTSLHAQQKASPAKSSTADVNGNSVTIRYSSPSVKGRTIWGGLVPYDKVWRTGANEATVIEVSKDCKMGGKDVKAGTYTLFTIPKEGDWTVILNSVLGQWGAYKYDKSKDVARFSAKTNVAEPTEMFDISVEDSGVVTMTWDKLSASFEIK
ncbi:MAG: DUF2911 domain-containing protein [Reichenbachiella sp.]